MKVRIKMVAVVMLAGLTLVGTASAYSNRGGSYHHGQVQGGPVNQTVDQATQDKIKTFWDSNQSLQKEMMMKNAERQAMFNTTNPDPTAVAKITGELFDLRTKLIAKAEAAGVDGYIGHHAMNSRQMSPVHGVHAHGAH